MHLPLVLAAGVASSALVRKSPWAISLVGRGVDAIATSTCGEF